MHCPTASLHTFFQKQQIFIFQEKIPIVFQAIRWVYIFLFTRMTDDWLIYEEAASHRFMRKNVFSSMLNVNKLQTMNSSPFLMDYDVNYNDMMFIFIHNRLCEEFKLPNELLEFRKTNECVFPSTSVLKCQETKSQRFVYNTKESKIPRSL